MAGSCEDPVVGPSQESDDITVGAFKSAMFMGYEKYKNRETYLPSNNSENKDISQYGTKGVEYELCGLQNIANIDDVVTNEELVFLYRKNNPNKKISLKDFVGNGPQNNQNSDSDESNLNGPQLQKAQKIFARKQLVLEHLDDAIESELKDVGGNFGMPTSFEKSNLLEGKRKKATELAMIEAMNFFLKMHQGDKLQDYQANKTYYIRDTGNSIKAMNDLIRHAGFLLKYHTAFAKVYADVAACTERKIFKKKDSKGKTVFDYLTKKSFKVDEPIKQEEDILEEILTSDEFKPGKTDGSCKYSLDVAGSAGNTPLSPSVVAPTAVAVFESFSPSEAKIKTKGKKGFDQKVKSKGTLVKKASSISSVNVESGSAPSSSGSLSDRIASAQRVTSDFNNKVKAVFKKLRESKLKRNIAHKSTKTGSGNSAESFSRRTAQNAKTLQTLESDILNNLGGGGAKKGGSISKTKKKHSATVASINKKKARKTNLRKSKNFKRRKKSRRSSVKSKKVRRKNNFTKLIRSVRKKRSSYNSLEKDSIFLRISKAYMREGLTRLNEVGIDKSKLPSSGKKYLNSESDDLFKSVE